MENEYSVRIERIVTLSDLIADYINKQGNISRAQRKKITAYRAPLVKMRSDERLEPIAKKLGETIKAIERSDFNGVARLAGEVMALADRIDA